MATKFTYVYLMILLIVGTQLATSKSVDERTLALRKRQATTEQSTAETESTTTNPEEEDVTETTTIQETTTTPAPPPPKRATKPSKPRRQSVKASTTMAPTTPAEEEAEEEEEEGEQETSTAPEEEAPTVKPLATDKGRPNKPKKPSATTPSVLTRINGDDDQSPTPSTNLLPPNMPINPQSQGYFPPGQQDPGFNPWRFNPMPTPPSVAGPYDYPHPSGPAFSDSRVGTANGAGTSGTGAFAGSFASASASAGGTGGGMVSTSIGGGTGPGGAVQQSSSSFSSSGGPFPAQASAQAPTPNVNSRGSFPEDDESVGIEVNGPETYGPAAAGAPGGPVRTAGPNYGSISGPGYSAQAGFGAAPNPYANTIPQYGPSPYGPNPFDFQNFFQQYFAAMQAQQLAFQRQIEAQIQAQQQAGGTFASGGATITNAQGVPDPNAQVYVNARSSANSASASTAVDSRSGVGGSKSTVVAYPTPSNKNDSNNRIWDQNRVDSNFGAQSVPGGVSGAAPYGGPGSQASGPVSAFASGSIGPQGGFQSAQINPAAPGIFSRFGEDIPPPSGNNYGVFSSSSSSSSVGPDGKQTSKKTATVAVNDNGKISVKTVHDP